MMALGYQKKLIQNMETKTVVEYRFIPRSIYEDQFGPVKLEGSFQDMFEKQDVFFRMIQGLLFILPDCIKLAFGKLVMLSGTILLFYIIFIILF